VFFKIGEKVVYPSHGIATIEEISTKIIEGNNHHFYHLRLSATNSTVLVPINNAKQIGIREPIDLTSCEKLWYLLGTTFSPPASDWKDRFKEFSDKMRTGDLFCVAEILKHLTYLSQLKPLSFREKRLLERARFLVVSELSTAASMSEKEVNLRMDQLLSKACSKQEYRQARALAAG
jgi:CarD family transcriptional regulator